MNISEAELKHQAALYYLENEFEFGSNNRAIVFGYIEWLKNSAKGGK